MVRRRTYFHISVASVMFIQNSIKHAHWNVFEPDFFESLNPSSNTVFIIKVFILIHCHINYANQQDWFQDIYFDY